jgi:anti-sigma-K factor RskA
MTPLRSTDALARVAGEYVLGTLQGPARRGFERAIRRNEEAQRLVAAWATLLSAVAEIDRCIPPPERVWEAIRQRLEEKRRRI